MHTTVLHSSNQRYWLGFQKYLSCTISGSYLTHCHAEKTYINDLWKIYQSKTSLTFKVVWTSSLLLFSQIQVSDKDLWGASNAGRFACLCILYSAISRSHSQLQIFPSSKMKNKDKIKPLNLLTVNTRTIEKELHRLSFSAAMERLYCSSDFLRASFSLLSSVFIYHANCCLEKNKEKYYTRHNQLVLRGKVLSWSLRHKKMFQCHSWISLI